ncbi:MAG: hypothetical protein HN348_24435 [Proteobacteria bacterium]|jgi:hypothetical protein|nr:hypothetical protein [Pseudomonadota bacterium]
MRRLLSLALVFPALALADIPVGEEVDGAVLVDVTPSGFDTITSLIPSLIPGSIVIPDIHMYDYEETCIIWCWDWYEYSLDVNNGWVDIGVNNAQITPGYDVLDLSATALVTVNNYWDPIYIAFDAYLIEFINIDGTCEGYMDPITVDIWTPIYVDIVQNPITMQSELDVTVPDPIWTWNANGDKLHIDCGTLTDVIDGLNWVLGIFGVNIYDFVIGPAEDLIDEQVMGMIPELEQTIEEAFNAANIHEEFPITDDVILSIDLAPDDVVITPSGMRLSMLGAIETDMDECIEEYGIHASLETASSDPSIGSAPVGLPFQHDVGAFIDDDFLNQAMFGIWYGGLLCQVIEDDGTLPIALDTNLLGLLAPGVYDEFFSEAVPIMITTRPAKPLEAYAQGPHDVNVSLTELGLDFHAELDGRMTRMVGVNLEAEAGVDLVFDDQTGEIVIDVAFDADDVVPSITFNEFTPEANDTIVASFSSVFDSLVGPILGGLTGDLAFALPTFEGLGLTGLKASAAGPSNDYFGFFATAGQPSYPGAGCDDSGGCGDTGGAGCTTGHLPSRIAFLLLPVLLACFRRRQQSDRA